MTRHTSRAPAGKSTGALAVSIWQIGSHYPECVPCLGICRARLTNSEAP